MLYMSMESINNSLCVKISVLKFKEQGFWGFGGARFFIKSAALNPRLPIQNAVINLINFKTQYLDKKFID